MISFNEAEWVVVVGLLIITFFGAWTMSMHFERNREIRRRQKLGEQVAIDRKPKKLVDHERNILGQVKNLIKERGLEGLEFDLLPKSSRIDESTLELIYRGRHVCSISCMAKLNRLRIIDFTTMSTNYYEISQVAETVEYALFNHRKW